MGKEQEKLDLITVWRGRDSVTYRAEDFEKLGDKAKPLWIKQWPGTNTPFNEMKLEDVDRVFMHQSITKEDFDYWESSWDIVALKKLLPVRSTPTNHNPRSTNDE